MRGRKAAPDPKPPGLGPGRRRGGPRQVKCFLRTASLLAALLAALCLLLTACGHLAGQGLGAGTSLQPRSGSATSGQANFRQQGDRVLVRVEVSAHEQVLKRARVSACEIQAAVRIAAVMQAAAAADRSRVEIRAWEDQPVTA